MSSVLCEIRPVLRPNERVIPENIICRILMFMWPFGPLTLISGAAGVGFKLAGSAVATKARPELNVQSGLCKSIRAVHIG